MVKRFGIRLMFICGIGAAPQTFAGWNLPYRQPDAYDYSAYYSHDVQSFLAANPAWFSDKLKSAWEYYKSHYIRSNGLVNHMRCDGACAQNDANIIGTNESVSEGQGYGMLLALLNNDQQTFNRIFEAANTYMWNSSTKSYFNWRLPSCGAECQGAATDADLDIGLALVFADRLQSEGLWERCDYRTRAMDIIRSIRQNMTQNDYLLPGDNWQGNGLDNQNPSYYAVAWMKVFNAYQNEVDFDPVIDKCYEVLSKVPRYSRGQAPDWCTRSGGRASKGSLAMGQDGIRTPWRIAMDALWFGDQRAVQFCANSKLTLSNYNDPAGIVSQMTMYDENGNRTDSMAHAAAMWACAILGSGDNNYRTKGLNGFVFTKIMGQYSYMGSKMYKDYNFYYNQSVAMLGFAAVTGQFPNIWADELAPNEATGFHPKNRLGRAETPLIVRGNQVLFTSRAAGYRRASIYSSNGARVCTQTLSSAGVTRPFRLNTGSYMVHLEGAGGGKSFRIIIP